MRDDLGLLLEAISFEGLARLQLVRIAAERVAHQRQIKKAALLRLPDVGHLVNKEALATERLFREVFGPDAAVGMEIDVSHGSHCRIARMEGPPFALHQPYARVIDRIAEHRARKLDLAGGERALLHGLLT